MNSAEKLTVEALKAKIALFTLKYQPCWVCGGRKTVVRGSTGQLIRQRVKKECPLCGGEGIIPR